MNFGVRNGQFLYFAISTSVDDGWRAAVDVNSQFWLWWDLKATLFGGRF